MRWTDIYELAEALHDKYPDFDVIGVKFTDLCQMVLGLEGFQDNVGKPSEKILEAIQAAWLEEKE